MAGSYNHIVGPGGKLLSNKDFAVMIENLGDAYGMTEEMYGMIWYLANLLEKAGSPLSRAEIVEIARKNYQLGIMNDSPGIAD